MILRGIIAGAVLLVLGLALFTISIPGQSVESQGIDSTFAATFNESLVSLEPITYTISWAEPIAITVTVYSCGTDSSCSGSSAYEIPANLVAQQTAAIGSITFTGIAGDGYEVFSNTAASVNIVYDGPIFGGVVGLLFLVVGAIVLVAGAAVPAGGLRPPSSVKDSVLRQPGEMLRWYWNGNWDGAPGGLLLSNLRLVLLDRRDLPGEAQFTTRESLRLPELVAVELSATSFGASQLVLKTAQGAPRVFTLEGKIKARRAAKAIQRASLMQAAAAAGARKGGRPVVAAVAPGGSVDGSASAAYSGTAPPGTVVYKEREVIREVVRIPCRFCGQLNDQLSMKCAGCGAPTGRA